MRAAARLAASALVVTAAVAPPRASSLSQDFFCFFDPGSAELTPRCQAIAFEFVAQWDRRRRGEARGWPDGQPVPARTSPVEVEGHADAAEAAAGKASIGRARAEAVAAFLRLNGVPAEVIKVAAFGADRLLVPVRGAEPQNRRVQLIRR